MNACDVLVVGSGGTALRAAIAACEAEPHPSVVLVTKGTLGHSGVTATACSDRMAFHATLPTTEPGGPDAWRYHAEDIYRIGGCVSDGDLADILARDSAEAFAYLDRLGVPWVRRADGTVDQFVTDGSLYARACYTGPYTANHIEAALVRRVRDLPIRVIENHLVGELLTDKAGQVRGAALVAQRDGHVTALAARAVVLATGGAGQAFAVNVYPPDCTGDGYALAYRAGGELVNLEFIQIGLCSLKTKLACSGDMMRALPRLVDADGNEFLPRYFPPDANDASIYGLLFSKGASWPVSEREPSRLVDIAVASELAAGRRVFLDYGHDPVGLNLAALPEAVRAWYETAKGVELADRRRAGTPLARLQAINRPAVEWLAARGIELASGDRIEVAPAVQHFQGGVKIRTRAETSVAGLYAAGEVAGGQHGANRPGGNALLDCQVFGRIAGESAAAFAAGQIASGPSLAIVTDEEAEHAVRGLLSVGGAEAATVREQVARAMSRDCGVYRTERSLDDLCRALEEMERRGVAVGDGSIANAVEAVNIIQVARLVARAALERDESRGPHLRFLAGGTLEPLPRDDHAWNRYIVLRKGEAGSSSERRRPVGRNA